MSERPFWQRLSLEQMTDQQWESVCDGCGQCCLNKLQDAETDVIYFTNVACNQLDLTSCRCSNYPQRFQLEPDCIKLDRENLKTFFWLPKTCGYRLLAEGKSLPIWHPLRQGNSTMMHSRRISVRHIAVHENEVQNWEDHIIAQQAAPSTGNE